MKNILIVSLIILGLFCWQLKKWIYEPRPLTTTAYILTEGQKHHQPQEAYIVIKKGSSSSLAAAELAKAGVIDKPWLFRLAARVYGLDKKLKAGEYVFSGAVSLYDVIQKLAKGDVFYHRLTLAEGLTTKQMLQIIEAESALSGAITLKVKEGELLPETYSFTRGDTKDSLILQAQKSMQVSLQTAWDNRQDNLPLKNQHDLLILASIIEKETAVDSERGLVASVFVNRLQKGMKLQTDPTVIYALTQGQSELDRALTRKDLAIDNPYNTYKYYGLPPAPICNPGKASLEAAANPETSSYLYFVANGIGGHNFAISLKEHNNNVLSWKNKQK